MSEEFCIVINTSSDMVQIDYGNFQFKIDYNPLIEVEGCPGCSITERGISGCSDITEAKENIQFLLEEIEQISTELIGEMNILNGLSKIGINRL